MTAANLSPTAHHIFNIIEDWRVEHELVKRYPGCREHFDWLNRHLYLPKQKRKKRKAGGEIPPAFFILDYVLHSVNLADVPELEEPRRSAGRIIDKNWPKLRVKIDAILEQIPVRCLSTHDCIAVALEILSLLEAEAQKQKSAQTSPQATSDTESSQKDEANQPSSELLNCSSEDENNAPQRGENEYNQPDTSLDADENTFPQRLEQKLKEAIFGKDQKKRSSGFSVAIERELSAQSLTPEVIHEAQCSS